MHQCVFTRVYLSHMTNYLRDWFIESEQQPLPNDVLFVVVDGVGGCLAPIPIHAIFDAEGGEPSDVEIDGVIGHHGQQHRVEPGLTLPLLQLRLRRLQHGSILTRRSAVGGGKGGERGSIS